MNHLKIAMIGLDTSHVVAFAKLLHHTDDPWHVPGACIVAAFPGGSDDFALSRDRVGGYTARMRDEFEVEIADSPEAAAAKADAVLLESVDGRVHRAQFEKIAPFGKPVFIDKPIAASSDKDGAIFIGDSEVRWEQLAIRVAEEGGDKARDKAVFIRADGRAPYQAVARVMARLSASGFTKLNLITDTAPEA